MLWAVRIFKRCWRKLFLRVMFVLASISGLVTLLFALQLPQVLWYYPTAEQENYAPTLQNLQVNIRQNSTGGSRQGNK